MSPFPYPGTFLLYIHTHKFFHRKYLRSCNEPLKIMYIIFINIICLISHLECTGTRTPHVHQGLVHWERKYIIYLESKKVKPGSLLGILSRVITAEGHCHHLILHPEIVLYILRINFMKMNNNIVTIICLLYPMN